LRTSVIVAGALAHAVAFMAVPASAYPVGGTCTVVYPYASTCGNAILCQPGSIVAVVVVGFGYGFASCGGARVGGRTANAATATASTSGYLTCGVDPGSGAAFVVNCTVTP
jgi:hypothetical protein